MANHVSNYSGSQIDAVIELFHNKGLGQVVGLVARDDNGNFSYADIGDLLSVTDGSAAEFTQGTDSFNGATLGMGTDTTDKGMLIISFGGGSFTQGEDSFTANTPTSVSIN